MRAYDVAVVGGGCVGVSVAKQLAEDTELDVGLMEKEHHLAEHQTGRNSGIIKPGFNFEPNSLRAELTIKGTRQMKSFHREHDIPVKAGGVTLLAASESDIEQLHRLREEAQKNEVTTRLLDSRDAIHEVEPYAGGKAALHCPEAASVDSQLFLYTLANEARKQGVTFHMGHKVERVSKSDGDYTVHSSNGTIKARYLVNAAGLYADKFAHSLDVGTDYQIIPFRGEYYELIPEKAKLVNSMIYPTPDPDLPFLGVHYTRRVDEKVILGPNAVLAFGKEAYENTDVNLSELADVLRYRGFWNLISSPKMMNASMAELHKSFSKRRFITDAKKLVPNISESDFRKSYSGIRSQLVRTDGELIKQPTVVHDGYSTHVLQTAWMTSSLPFGEMLAEEITDRLCN